MNTESFNNFKIYKISIPGSGMPDYSVGEDGVVKIVEEYKITDTYRSDPDYKLVYYVVFEDNTRIEIDGKIQNLIIYSNVQNIQK